MPAKFVEKARQIANQYRVVTAIRPDGLFGGWAIEMPLVLARGKSESECVASTREALVDTVAFMLEKGEAPPSPASDGKREVQLNIRLTPDERTRIEEKARQAGFRSIADFMRRAALRGVA